MTDLDIPRTSSADPSAAPASSASVASDKYDQMLALADLFDSSGNEMRTRARLGAEILGDDDVVDSGELSKATWGQAEGAVRADGADLGDAEAAAALSAVHSEGRGRLRILAAEVSERATTSVGVVSWVLLKDGWHSLTPRHDDGARVAVARVDHDALATELAPVLAQVTIREDATA